MPLTAVSLRSWLPYPAVSEEPVTPAEWQQHMTKKESVARNLWFSNKHCGVNKAGQSEISQKPVSSILDKTGPSQEAQKNSDSLEVVVVGRGQFLTGVQQRLQPLVLILNAADRQR